MIQLKRTLMLCAAAAAAVCLTAMPAVAQQDTLQPAPPGAPVVFRGDTLFRLTGTLGPFTPEERAAALARRIDRLAEDPLAKAADLTVVDSAGVTDIRLGDVVVMSVTERDAAEAGVARRALAERWAAIAQEAIRSRETAASLKSVLLGIFFTLLATGVLVLAIIGLNRLFPVVYHKLESWRGTKIPALKIQKLEVISADRMADAALFVAQVARIAAFVVLIVYYLPLVFSFFPWTQGLASTLFGWVLDPLGRALNGFVNYLPSLFSIAVIVVVVWYLLKFIHLFFAGIERGAIAFPGFYKDWADPTYKIVRFLVIAFAAIMIYPYLPGSGTGAFQGISVFLGVLISFGSASAIANVVAGVVMTYMRPFHIGDRVKIADTVGDVVQKTLLVTRVRTIKNVDVTIPNAMVLSSHIINYSSSSKDRGVILHTAVTIGYDIPWQKVHGLLIAAAQATDQLLEKPEPFVLQTALNDYNVTYELNAHTDQPNIMAKIYSELHRNIQERFNEAGVEIMSPAFTAVRDGNKATIPDEYLPAGYSAPGFRVTPLADLFKRARETAPAVDPRD